MLAGPHPRSLALRRSKTRYPRAGRRRFLCSRGPTPARSRCSARRLAILARAAGASYARGAPPPLARAAALEDSLSSRGPQALPILAGPHILSSRRAPTAGAVARHVRASQPLKAAARAAVGIVCHWPRALTRSPRGPQALAVLR